METRLKGASDPPQEQRSSRCATQSRGRRVSSISRLAVSCGGCFPFRIAVTISGARKASLRRRVTYELLIPSSAAISFSGQARLLE